MPPGMVSQDALSRVYCLCPKLAPCFAASAYISVPSRRTLTDSAELAAAGWANVSQPPSILYQKWLQKHMLRILEPGTDRDTVDATARGSHGRHLTRPRIGLPRRRAACRPLRAAPRWAAAAPPAAACSGRWSARRGSAPPPSAGRRPSPPAGVRGTQGSRVRFCSHGLEMGGVIKPALHGF